uniref:TAFH domain-containing protein n=1 Tax=Caenorhabditis tropicalis TaxID=1561998 RepID=A0A1I7T540_9PELO
MSLPRFRLVQGKALGERSTPPAGVNMPPEPTPPPQPHAKEIDYVPEDPDLQNIKQEDPISPPNLQHNYGGMGGTSQPQQIMQQRPMPTIQHHYQQQPPHQPSQQPSHQPPQQPPQHLQQPPQLQNNQSSEDKNVQKCVRFLKTLISLSNNDDPEMPDKAARVKTLIQEVIYMETTAEDFTKDLQQVLRSQAQPHLLPFLQNTLPALRNAVRNGSASVEGVHPPPGYVFNNGRVPQPHPPMMPPQQIQQPPQHQMVPPIQNTGGSQQIINRLNEPIGMPRGAPNIQQRLNNQGSIPIQRTMSGQQPQHIMHQPPPPQQNPQPIPPSQPPMPPQTPQNMNNMAPPSQPMEIDQPQSNSAEPPRTRHYPEGSLKSSILKPDEVLNRITKRMMASCSVEEEALVAISDAVESHLRELIAMMAGVAEHRVESMRIPENYVAIDDVKRQLRFLEDVDRQEEEMRESREKESLIRMSKNKNSGKETIEKAKEMQRADAEAKRNRDANAAAIAALSSNRTVKNKWESGGASSTAPRPRTVRVTTRDLHLLVNEDSRFSGTFLREKLSYGGPAIEFFGVIRNTFVVCFGKKSRIHSYLFILCQLLFDLLVDLPCFSALGISACADAPHKAHPDALATTLLSGSIGGALAFSVTVNNGDREEAASGIVNGDVGSKDRTFAIGSDARRIVFDACCRCRRRGRRRLLRVSDSSTDKYANAERGRE